MLRSPFRHAVLAAGVILALPASANAHIQVTPNAVAPGDPVRFTVLVPGESDVPTTKVELKVPKGVLPFSFSSTPGWKRELIEASDGSIDQVVWTGSAAADEFAEFSFLAGTPESPGELAWKAIQTYQDGETSDWIGPEGSEQPAPITVVSEDAPRQNAGGESSRDADAPATEAAAAQSQGSDDGDDEATRNRALSLAALALAAVALVFAVTGRRRRS